MTVELDAVDWGIKTTRNIKVDYLGEFPNPEHISPFQYDVSTLSLKKSFIYKKINTFLQPNTHPDLVSPPNFMFNSAKAFKFRIFVTRSQFSSTAIIQRNGATVLTRVLSNSGSSDSVNYVLEVDVPVGAQNITINCVGDWFCII